MLFHFVHLKIGLGLGKFGIYMWCDWNLCYFRIISLEIIVIILLIK